MIDTFKHSNCSRIEQLNSTVQRDELTLTVEKMIQVSLDEGNGAHPDGIKDMTEEKSHVKSFLTELETLESEAWSSACSAYFNKKTSDNVKVFTLVKVCDGLQFSNYFTPEQNSWSSCPATFLASLASACDFNREPVSTL